MVLHRFNAFQPIPQFRTEMDRWLSSLADAPLFGNGERAKPFPALNVWEQDETFYAEAELPGLKNEDLEISVVGNELSIKGHRPETTEEGITYHRQERGTGEFVRVVRLPVEVDPDKVQASLTDGVLRLVLPKAEAAKPRRIEVAAQS
jgi:HSP20 family protein